MGNVILPVNRSTVRRDWASQCVVKKYPRTHSRTAGWSLPIHIEYVTEWRDSLFTKRTKLQLCHVCFYPTITYRRCGAATAVWRSMALAKGRAATLLSSWRRCSVREAGTPRAVPQCWSTAVGCTRRWSLMAAPWKTSPRRTGATRCWTQPSRRETWRLVSVLAPRGQIAIKDSEITALN